MILSRSSRIPQHCSLKIRPSCHTLSNALDISRKTDQASRVGLQSKAVNIVWTIDSNWFMVESAGRKPDWFGFNKLFT